MRASAWEEGFQARQKGKEAPSNPYGRETQDYLLWQEGYLCAAA